MRAKPRHLGVRLGIFFFLIFHVKELVGHSKKGVYDSGRAHRITIVVGVWPRHKADRAVIQFPSDFKSHVNNRHERVVLVLVFVIFILINRHSVSGVCFVYKIFVVHTAYVYKRRTKRTKNLFVYVWRHVFSMFDTDL